MTDFVYDRFFDTEGTSSVIDEVFYDAEQKRLLVQLVRSDWHGNPVLAGYENVPADVFTAMESLNTNRLNGDNTASVGSYWNLWIKPHFTGFDTGSIDVAVEREEEQVEAPATLNENEFVVSGTVTGEQISVAGLTSSVLNVPEPVKNEFTITFVDSDNVEAELAVYAPEANEALVRFGQIVDLAQWGTVKILSITQHFS